METTTVSRDGTRIAYERSGRGPAVVLVSGAMSTGATMAPLAAELAERFDVTVYDRRGRGESAGTEPYGVEREVEDLAALIEAVGGEASLYGISSGGALVLRAAASGLPVRRVAVYEVPYAMDDAAVRAGAEYRERLSEALGQGRRGDAVELFLRLAGLGEDMIRGARESPMWAGMESVAPSLAHDAAVMGDNRVPRSSIASVGCPVLALAGGASDTWWHDAARAVAEAAPDGTYGTVEGQAHMVEPGMLAPVLTEFFGR
ncbi:alpha/beta fold hydrolase [Streptomyces sp. AC602_WCS936]|uniref:alpha/beta fold hydrolase n=1 Tax=Streptomyces sp. AC602_WCS936 TaxID=2823685 RepID=UPI001C27E292|nr:alpha/beta hydrolase [Streptomyces sp. AC602_WCS936]